MVSCSGYCDRILHLDTTVAETEVPSSESPELSKVPSTKPEASQNIALRALPTALNFV